MYYYLISPTIQTDRKESTLTYHSEHQLHPGQLVLIPVGKKEVVGIIIRETTKPTHFKTRPVQEILETQPLPAPLLTLAHWMATYYRTHPASIWHTFLPRGLTKKRRTQQTSLPPPQRKRTKIVLNEEQQHAIQQINSMQSGTALLQGITGSGKTQVYIELAKEALQKQKSVIILVPEIALTSQLVAELTHHFDNVIITHSTMTESQRHLIWRNALYSTKPHIIIGPRSALFTPLPNIGLVVIDECHEPSFKQEQAPRYSALRVASVLAQQHAATLVLGSATPSITDRFLAETTNSPIIHLTQLAQVHAQQPHITTIDMKQREHFSKHRFLSNQLIQSIEDNMRTKHQSLVFHNRRGSAPTTLCQSCGWQAACERCHVPLTLHADTYNLRCHICGIVEKMSPQCPECGQPDIVHKGIGTKMINDELQRLFPQATIRRFDTDATRDASVNALYQELYDGSIDIIVGTQVIAKGLDLPKLRTVGVVQADSGLSLPDYQSSERVFQLIAQVRGRVGRTKHPSKIIIQTHHPQHPSITYGIQQNYDAFYHTTLQERYNGNFPPYTHMLKLTCSYKTEKGAIQACQKLAATLQAKAPSDVTILGPAPSFYERLRDTYRWQLIIKSPKREHLINLLEYVPAQKWHTELDPISLL